MGGSSVSTDYGYLHHNTPPGALAHIEQVPVRWEYSDRYLARYEGRWRRIHIQVRRLYIVYKGERITIMVEGL
jgi:hypothetical protein